MIAGLVREIGTPAASGALSLLVAEAKKQEARQEIDALLQDRTPLYGALVAADPKTRKNAARLLGALRTESDAERLAAALFAENTLFVVPSLLLALGSVGGECARAALERYLVPAPKDATEEKHVREISEALAKAVGAFAAPLEKRLTRLPAPETVLLLPPEGFCGVLADELRSLGFSPEPNARGVEVVTDDLRGLFRARCFFEALLPVASRLKAEPGAIAGSLDGRISGAYRIELRNYPGDRAAFIRALTAAIGGANNPSAYDTEVRVLVAGDTADVFLKPCNVQDARFSYRVQALPASIHPATAAAINRYAAPYRTVGNPNVLDPFCGSGTMLFERERLSPCASLTGVDVSGNAIRIARGNAAAGHSRARFVQKDILRFDARGAFDEVIANLPFGNRVGTHDENERLYRGFVEKLPALLNPGGLAVLYTMEYRLLRRCLEGAKQLDPVAKTRTEAGGLLPWVFLIRRK